MTRRPFLALSAPDKLIEVGVGGLMGAVMMMVVGFGIE